jgi:hypothetical protein
MRSAPVVAARSPLVTLAKETVRYITCVSHRRSPRMQAGSVSSERPRSSRPSSKRDLSLENVIWRCAAIQSSEPIRSSAFTTGYRLVFDNFKIHPYT